MKSLYSMGKTLEIDISCFERCDHGDSCFEIYKKKYLICRICRTVIGRR